MSDVNAAIQDFLATELLSPGTELDAETPLLTTELLDSMGVLTLVGFVEDEFGIIVNADEVSVENFASVRTVAQLVESKLQ